ncbi:hypothetical protein CVT24_011507 [Panaeolus cyanescens]|uniref:Uncharacterized protein n=1 Tax=Panaeolus cyanescens TaxID=181874 RepID=A0A409VGP3_9AGAR|nr:hypothetical protein CVT24_011507 [Panaeolus cyanescens]
MTRKKNQSKTQKIIHSAARNAPSASQMLDRGKKDSVQNTGGTTTRPLLRRSSRLAHKDDEDTVPMKVVNSDSAELMSCKSKKGELEGKKNKKKTLGKEEQKKIREHIMAKKAKKAKKIKGGLSSDRDLLESLSRIPTEHKNFINTFLQGFVA